MSEAADWAAETEERVLDSALEVAPSLGWNSLMIRKAASACGMSVADAELLLPHGARDLAALLSRRHDRAGLGALCAVDPASLKVRERIAAGIEARLEAAAADGEAVRRWIGFLAMPQNAGLGLSLAWESADVVWRWAGDTATDENHYSKRAILSGILIPALSLRLSGGPRIAGEFVAARIESVMAFEKWKAGIKPSETARRAAAALGSIRYARG